MSVRRYLNIKNIINFNDISICDVNDDRLFSRGNNK